MLKERASQMILKLKQNPALVQDTLKFTDSLRKDKIQDLNLPITYCSGPIKEKIRAQLRRKAFEHHERNISEISKREEPVLALLNSIELLQTALQQPAELAQSQNFSKQLLKKEEQFKREREFYDFKIKILQKFHAIVNLNEKEKQSLFGNPYQISRDQVLRGLYHVGQIKLLKQALDKLQNEEHKSQLLGHLQNNISTIESNIEMKVFQILKDIFRKKTTPEELMENSDNLAFVKYGFELAQKADDPDLLKQLIMKFKANLTSSIKLEARNIAQISSAGTVQHLKADFSFLGGDQEDEQVKDRYDLEIVNWSDALSWLYQTSKQLTQLLKHTLREKETIEPIQREVLQSAIDALLLQKGEHWKRRIPRGIIKPIYNILCDYDSIVSEEGGDLAFILKELFTEFKKKVVISFSEVQLGSMSRSFHEYLILRDANPQLNFEKLKTQFLGGIAFYNTLEGSEELLLKEMKLLILKNPKEYIHLGYSLLAQSERKVSLEQQNQEQTPYYKQQISLLQYAMTKINERDWEEMLQSNEIDVEYLKEKQILNLRKDLLDSLQK